MAAEITWSDATELSSPSIAEELANTLSYLTTGGKGLFIFGALPGLPLNQVSEMLSKPRRTPPVPGAGSRCESEPKRKRCTLNKAEELILEHHQVVRPTVLSVYDEIRVLLSKPHVLQLGPMDKSETNSESSCDEKEPRPLHLSTTVFPPKICKTSGPCLLVELSSTSGNVAHCGELANCLFSNSSDRNVTLECMENRYHIPRNCNFLMSDVAHFCPLVDYCSEDSNRCNVVVVDPPWSNKSAFRSKSYNCLSFVEICNIPVPKFLAFGALVLVWATNDRKVVNYVRNVIFPTWSVDYVTEWSWLKVALSGEMVSDLDSFHCKPYESLLVGIFMDNCHFQHGFVPKSPSGVEFENIPPEFVLCSVPSVVHSQKPNLGPVIEHCLSGDTALADLKCLELFARNLTPGWTSWGNEVLKFQQL